MRPAQEDAGSPPAARRSANRLSSGPNAEDDKNKVYDAIIMAASTVAVLIANVTYVGEFHRAVNDRHKICSCPIPAETVFDTFQYQT